MNCTNCGKEIPEGENKLCEECQKNLLNNIVEVENEETTHEVEENSRGKKVKIEKETFEKRKKIKQRNKFIILFFILLIALFVIVELVNANKVGNTIGNIRNRGYATKSGSWLYFLSPNEDTTQVGIYKMKENDRTLETKQELIMDEWSILSLNVSKDYVYFIGILPEAFSDTDEIDNKIYRMKTDGTNLEVINDNEFDNNCYEIYVIGDNIYYIGTDYNVYKMSVDGSNRKLVLNSETGYLGITNKYIVYNVKNEDGTDYITYIADIDGKNQRPIMENERLYSVNIVGNYIYYADEEKYICRVKLDGTDQKVLYEETAYNMNVSDDYIYYFNYADEIVGDYTVCMYKVKTDGSTVKPELLKKFEEYSSFLNIIGNWIIYMDSSETEGYIELLRKDGKEEKRVYNVNFEELYEKLEAENTENIATP